ncbi:MAG: hypothetical protein ABIN01_00510 [Ferruginibacter sp.]
MKKKMTKSLPVSKRMVYNSYLKVVDKDGGAGIDKQRIEMFNEELSGNLYKIWNLMTSGSCFPPPGGFCTLESRRRSGFHFELYDLRKEPY